MTRSICRPKYRSEEVDNFAMPMADQFQMDPVDDYEGDDNWDAQHIGDESFQPLLLNSDSNDSLSDVFSVVGSFPPREGDSVMDWPRVSLSDVDSVAGSFSSREGDPVMDWPRDSLGDVDSAVGSCSWREGDPVMDWPRLDDDESFQLLKSISNDSLRSEGSTGDSVIGWAPLGDDNPDAEHIGGKPPPPQPQHSPPPQEEIIDPHLGGSGLSGRENPPLDGMFGGNESGLPTVAAEEVEVVDATGGAGLDTTFGVGEETAVAGTGREAALVAENAALKAENAALKARAAADSDIEPKDEEESSDTEISKQPRAEMETEREQNQKGPEERYVQLSEEITIDLHTCEVHDLYAACFVRIARRAEDYGMDQYIQIRNAGPGEKSKGGRGEECACVITLKQNGGNIDPSKEAVGQKIREEAESIRGTNLRENKGALYNLCRKQACKSGLLQFQGAGGNNRNSRSKTPDADRSIWVLKKRRPPRSTSAAKKECNNLSKRKRTDEVGDDGGHSNRDRKSNRTYAAAIMSTLSIFTIISFICHNAARAAGGPQLHRALADSLDGIWGFGRYYDNYSFFFTIVLGLLSFIWWKYMAWHEDLLYLTFDQLKQKLQYRGSRLDRKTIEKLIDPSGLRVLDRQMCSMPEAIKLAPPALLKSKTFLLEASELNGDVLQHIPQKFQLQRFEEILQSFATGSVSEMRRESAEEVETTPRDRWQRASASFAEVFRNFGGYLKKVIDSSSVHTSEPRPADPSGCCNSDESENMGSDQQLTMIENMVRNEVNERFQRFDLPKTDLDVIRKYFLNDLRLILKSCGSLPEATHFISEWVDAMEIALQCVRSRARATMHLPEKLRSGEWVKLLVALNGYSSDDVSTAAMNVAPNRVQELAIEGTKEALKDFRLKIEQCSNPNLKVHRDELVTLLKACRCGRMFDHASDAMKQNKEVVLHIARLYGNAMQFASPKLRSDGKFVIECIKHNRDVLYFVADNLKADVSFLLNALLCNVRVMELLGTEGLMSQHDVLSSNVRVCQELAHRYHSVFLRYLEKDTPLYRDCVLQAWVFQSQDVKDQVLPFAPLDVKQLLWMRGSV